MNIIDVGNAGKAPGLNQSCCEKDGPILPRFARSSSRFPPLRTPATEAKREGLERSQELGRVEGRRRERKKAGTGSSKNAEIIIKVLTLIMIFFFNRRYFKKYSSIQKQELKMFLD